MALVDDQCLSAIKACADVLKAVMLVWAGYVAVLLTVLLGTE